MGSYGLHGLNTSLEGQSSVPLSASELECGPRVSEEPKLSWSSFMDKQHPNWSTWVVQAPSLHKTQTRDRKLSLNLVGQASLIDLASGETKRKL